MSQITIFASAGVVPPPLNPDIEFIEGDDSIAVGPDATTHIIFLLGDAVQGVSTSGNALTNTETITVADSTTAQKGVLALASNAETIAGANTTKAVTPDDLKAKLGAQTANGLAYGAGQTSAIQWLGEAADGQIPIGQTGGIPVLANITSLSGTITITNTPGGIDLDSTATIISFPWTDEAVNFAAVENNGYFCTAGLTVTLPAAPMQGDTVIIEVDTAGVVVIQANAGQIIRMGQTASAIAGTATSTGRGDTLWLVYRTATSTWNSISTEGTWGIA